MMKKLPWCRSLHEISHKYFKHVMQCHFDMFILEFHPLEARFGSNLCEVEKSPSKFSGKNSPSQSEKNQENTLGVKDESEILMLYWWCRNQNMLLIKKYRILPTRNVPRLELAIETHANGSQQKLRTPVKMLVARFLEGFGDGSGSQILNIKQILGYQIIQL